MRTKERGGGRLPLSATVARRPDAIPFPAYFALVRRHLLVIVVFGLLGLVVGVVAAFQQEPIWVSGASVLAPAVAKDPQAPTDRPVRARKAMTLDSEAAVLRSERVLRRAVVGTSLTPAELMEITYVTAIPNSRVIRVQVRHQDPATAHLLTGNLAAAYLDSRQELLTERRSQQAEGLRRQIAALHAPSDVASDAYRTLQQADAQSPARGVGSDEVLDSVMNINQRIRELRQEVIELESHPVVSGELLWSASAPRRLKAQPGVPILSWLLIGLSVAGVVVAFRERRPRAPSSAAEVVRLPQSRDLVVGVFAGGQAVHDPSAGWVRMADAIGARPAAIMVLPLEGALPNGVIEVLGILLRRRGYSVSELLDFDHLSTDASGATATIRRIRSRDYHVLCEGPPLADFVGSLSATVTDGVILVIPAGAVPHRRLVDAMDDLSRLGLRVRGVVLDQSPDRGAGRDRPTARQTS